MIELNLKKLALVLLSIIAIAGCEEEKTTPDKVGDVNVLVTLNNYSSVEGALVYTNPPSKTGTTDQFGSVLLTGIETGSYEVYAQLENVGSGKSAINIKEDELSDVVVNIRENVFVGLAPTINLISPVNQTNFTESDTITFSAVIEDEDTPVEEIEVVWESDLDGVLNSDSPDAEGNVSFTTHSLTSGEHEITVSAEDNDGYSSSKSFNIATTAPASVTLHEPQLADGQVQLEWSEYPNSDFLHYEVYRSEGECSEQNAELLASITDKGTTNYTDDSLPLAYQVCYFIKVTNSWEFSSNSNQQIVELPSDHIFNFVPYDMLKHPTQPFVYLLDRGGQKFIKYDYEEMSTVEEVSLPGSIGHCAIGDNGYGMELYAPCTDGKIYVYSADDLTQTTTINAGLQTASVEVNGDGIVIASVNPSPWWEQPVRTYSRETGINIDGFGDNERDVLRRIPGKNEFISITTSVSPTDMEYFKLNDDGTLDIHEDDQYHGDYPLNANIFRISDDGTYVITSSSGAVYLANSSMEYKGQLQSGALNFSDFAFSEDGSIIYAATSNRKSVQIGHYPSLIRDDEILTRGYPEFIYRDGNQLIILSKSTQEGIISTLEVIDL